LFVSPLVLWQGKTKGIVHGLRFFPCVVFPSFDNVNFDLQRHACARTDVSLFHNNIDQPIASLVSPFAAVSQRMAKEKGIKGKSKREDQSYHNVKRWKRGKGHVASAPSISSLTAARSPLRC
jgi:hypothetical protein